MKVLYGKANEHYDHELDARSTAAAVLGCTRDGRRNEQQVNWTLQSLVQFSMPETAVYFVSTPKKDKKSTSR